MRDQCRSKTGIASLLHVKLSPMSALGPTGERQEHSDAIVSFAGARQRRRLFRGLDILTIKWSTGDLPEECRFLLNTQLMFLKKELDPTSKQFDDDEWIRSLTEAQEITADVPEDSVLYDQQEVDPKKVRPIQMGEILRKYLSRRLLALSEGGIAALTTAMRQIGVGSQGGAEALAIFNQLLYEEKASGSLNEPLARIKVDEKFCFGVIEWKAVWKAASRFLPKHTATAAWNPPMPKDRGAEQGDVDGPQECSLALGMVAAETRGCVAALQALGSLPRIGVDDPSEFQRLQAEHAVRRHETANFQLGGPGNFTRADDPRHSLQKNGGLADLL